MTEPSTKAHLSKGAHVTRTGLQFGDRGIESDEDRTGLIGHRGLSDALAGRTATGALVVDGYDTKRMGGGGRQRGAVREVPNGGDATVCEDPFVIRRLMARLLRSSELGAHPKCPH